MLYEACKGLVLAVMKTPGEPPEAPAGSHASVQVFRASPRYLSYRLLGFWIGMGCLGLAWTALVISAFVYRSESDHPLEPNHEVREAFWFPLPSLLEPARFVERPMRRSEIDFALPGILVGEPERHVVWGLTYRFLEGFFRIVGRPLPDRWSQRRAG